jgi:predicted RNase H-like nuclease/NTP pyrophosphatase (non-canonical NTP hydrolase)
MDTDAWRERIRAFADERDWGRFHDPKNLAMALSVEVAELVEVFQWMTPEESRAVMAGDRAGDVADEVADVLTYVLRLADVLDLDLDAALASKARRNAERYPVETSRGSSAKAPPLGRAEQAAPAATAGPPVPPPVEVTAPVLGVDACRAGWVGAVLEPDAPRPRVVVAPTISGLVELVRESLGLAVVGIDIPIGLPDSSLRQADALARKAIRGKAASVFTTLTRAAYAATTREEADAVNRRLVGQGVGAQAFGLREKILEVDAWLRTRPTVRVLEVHPEVSFATMAGRPIVPGKKTDEGRDLRLAALAAAGIARPSVLGGSGYAADDVIDACAVAWTAARYAAGLATSLPDPPEVFADGLPAAIWC